jgi:molybdopterin converting factor small subunit
MPKLRLSSSLRRLVEPPAEVLLVSGESVSACLAALVMQQPKLKAYVYQDNGTEVSPFISVYLNGKDVRFLAPEALQVGEADEIEVIASLAGG